MEGMVGQIPERNLHGIDERYVVRKQVEGTQLTNRTPEFGVKSEGWQEPANQQWSRELTHATPMISSSDECKKEKKEDMTAHVICPVFETSRL